MCLPMPRGTREREISRSMFRGKRCRVDMTVEAERLPMTSRIRKNNRLELENDDTPLGGLYLGRPTG
jgi:hypothetical protein